MKRIILLFIAIIACLVMAAAQADTNTIRQSVTDNRIEYTDTPAHPVEKGEADSHDSFPATMIPIVVIICIFGIPVSIVFIVLYFKYKNKKAKYRLIEQALAAGQPIPQEFFNEKNGHNIQQKGIVNIFTGIGLFIFLWAVTDEFGMGCVGLLIMFMGFGQVMIYYMNNKAEKTKKPNSKE